MCVHACVVRACVVRACVRARFIRKSCMSGDHFSACRHKESEEASAWWRKRHTKRVYSQSIRDISEIRFSSVNLYLRIKNTVI